MKKNRMMRLASGLLVAVLITTSTISGTFAKYTTSDSATDEARVAKWGVTVVANGTLYGEKYAADTSKITASDDNNVISVYGEQDAQKNVVAPGTKSDEGFHFAINGKPEVDSLVTMAVEHENIFLGEGSYGVMVEVEGVTAENFGDVGNEFYTYNDVTKEYTKANDFDAGVTKYFELHDEATVGVTGYWPVVYSMDGETVYTTGDVEEDTLKIIADIIVAKVDGAKSTAQVGGDVSKYAVAGVTKAIEQNTDFSTAMNLGDIGLSWIWEFSNGNDEKDTILGNLMAERIGDWKGDVVKYKDTTTDTTTYEQLVEGTDYCLDTNFTINITVEQVD